MNGTGGRRIRAALIASLALLLSGTVMAPGGSAASLCSAPPEVFPVADLEPGMMATAWTVVEGTEPVSFDVEIVGVLPDEIAPGVDFILVHVSGPVIDRTGGIAFGFSGSPVYIGDALVGSISYGFFGADQTFGGVTPAESMVKLFQYPDGTATVGVSATRQRAFAERVRITDRLRSRAARVTDTAVSAVPTVAQPLRVPVAVSGLNDRAFRRFGKTLRRAGLDVLPYRAGAARLGPLAADPIGPGDAVAGALSVGDLTFSGVGTATAVCDGLVLAFGHPFFWDGRAGPFPMAMYGANVVTVIPDPSQIFGAFKVARLTDVHGIIDQDRLTGIRGVEGVEPPISIPVTSFVTNPDLGTSRSGDTTVFRPEVGGFPILADIASFHLLANEDVVFDRIGDGSSEIRFVIEGTGPDGAPFRLERPNMFFSDFDITFESIFELFGFLWRIQDNPFGTVSFDGIHVDATLTQEHLVSQIVRVESASSLQPGFRERGRLRVRRGDLIRLRVYLLREGDVDEVRVDLAVPVPTRARFGGILQVHGGATDACLFCFFDEGGGGNGEPATFAELLRDLQRTPRNNDLVGTLEIGRSTRRSTFRADTVVQGREAIRIVVG